MDREAKRRIRKNIDTTRPLEEELGRVFEDAYDKEYNPSDEQVSAMEEEITTGRPRGFRQNATSSDRFIRIGEEYFRLEQRGRNHYYSPKKDTYYRQMEDGRFKEIEEN